MTGESEADAAAKAYLAELQSWRVRRDQQRQARAAERFNAVDREPPPWQTLIEQVTALNAQLSELTTQVATLVGRLDEEAFSSRQTGLRDTGLAA